MSFRIPTANVATSVGLTFDSFELTSFEHQTLEQLSRDCFEFTLHKEVCGVEHPLVDLKRYCGMSMCNCPLVEPSKIVYLPIVDMHADTTEAMETVVARLHKDYGVGVKANNLVVVGDQRLLLASRS